MTKLHLTLMDQEGATIGAGEAEGGDVVPRYFYLFARPLEGGEVCCWTDDDQCPVEVAHLAFHRTVVVWMDDEGAEKAVLYTTVT